MNNVTPNQIPISVSKYLDLPGIELSNLLFRLAKCKGDIYVEYDKVELDYNHEEFGNYQIIYTTKDIKPYTEIRYGEKYQILVGELDKYIYWTRSEKLVENKFDRSI